MGDVIVCVSNTTATSCHHQVNVTVGSVLTQPVMVTNGWTSGIVPSFLRLITIIIIMNDPAELVSRSSMGELHVKYLC